MAVDPHIAESLAVSYGAEDFYGPYELLWGLNSHYPNEADEEKRAVAEAALRRLVTEGLVELHECDTGPPYESPIPTPSALEAISEPTFWLTPAESGNPPFYWFASTPAGEEALREGRFKSL